MTSQQPSKVGKVCPHCKGRGNEPYHNPHTKEIEYGENALCQNCDVCLGQGHIPETWDYFDYKGVDDDVSTGERDCAEEVS